MKRSRSSPPCQIWLCCALPLLAVCCGNGRAAAAEYPDRLVWIFGWNLSRDGDVAEITRVLETAAASGINGAVFSLGLDTLCKKNPEYFQRLEAVQAACRRNQLEFIPAVFSVGYGGGILSHNRQLAEGLPVRDAPFLAHRRPLAPREASPHPSSAPTGDPHRRPLAPRL